MLEFGVADLESDKVAEGALALLCDYATDIMGGGEPLPEYTQTHLVEELRKRNNCCVLMAWEDQVPVALAICFEGFSTFACRPIMNIHDFVVAPAFRGQGISVKLLAEIESEAKRRGCCKLTLEVLEGNHVAQHVYKKFGFAAYELDPKMGRAMFYEKKIT